MGSWGNTVDHYLFCRCHQEQASGDRLHHPHADHVEGHLHEGGHDGPVQWTRPLNYQNISSHWGTLSYL